MPSKHLILCSPRPFLPSIVSSIRVFSNGSALHVRWPKYWSFSFNISPSNKGVRGYNVPGVGLWDKLDKLSGTQLGLLLLLFRVISDSVTPWTAAHEASLSFTISLSLLKFMSIDLILPSNHPILCQPLLLLPSIFPNIRVFSNELALCIRWPEYWSFSISPSNEYSGLIYFRIDWFDLLEVPGTLTSHLKHRSSKASILWHSAFFMVQLSHLYMTIGKKPWLWLNGALSAKWHCCFLL